MKNERFTAQTDRIYERDSYIKTFSAQVLSCIEIYDKENTKYGIVLDLTAFSPEGGGQKADTGFINDIPVVDVQNENGQIIHYTNEAIEEGSIITARIDFDKRFRKMQNHSGEHLFCGIIHNIYGYDNVGFHMNEDEVVLDINGQLDFDKLLEIEKKANQAIYEDCPITISFPTGEEAKKLEYRSKLDLTEDIRLVSIENYDLSACCAPHVSSTGQIGMIKLIDSFYHRSGTRITIKAGISAYEDYAKLDSTTRQLMKLLSSKRYETAEFALRNDDRYRKLIEENKSLKKELTKIEIDKIKSEIEKREKDDKSAVVIFSNNLDSFQIRSLINEIAVDFPAIIGVFSENNNNEYSYVIGRGSLCQFNLSLFAKDLNQRFNGKGGGKAEMIQGQLKGNENDIRDYFLNSLSAPQF